MTEEEDVVVVNANKWYRTQREASWSRAYKFQRNVVAALGIYEAFAIVTTKVPTISAICWRLRDDPRARGALFLGWGWLTFHLFTEQPGHTRPG